MGGFLLDLSNLLGKRVDVLSSETLHPMFRDKVLKNNISIMTEEIILLDEDERDYMVNIEKIFRFLGEYYDFIDKYTKEDVIKNREIRGVFRTIIQNPAEETVRQIPTGLKKIAKEINWREIREFRNYILRTYDFADWEDMWTFAQKKMKEIEVGAKRIQELLEAGVHLEIQKRKKERIKNMENKKLRKISKKMEELKEGIDEERLEGLVKKK